MLKKGDRYRNGSVGLKKGLPASLGTPPPRSCAVDARVVDMLCTPSGGAHSRADGPARARDVADSHLPRVAHASFHESGACVARDAIKAL